MQKRGKVNLNGRLQLSTEKAKQEENDGIVALRILTDTGIECEIYEIPYQVLHG